MTRDSVRIGLFPSMSVHSKVAEMEPWVLPLFTSALFLRLMRPRFLRWRSAK